MRFYWNKLGPKSNDWNPFKRRGSQRRTWKTPCEGRGWGWSEASTSQGRPRIASQPSWTRQGRSPPRAFGGAGRRGYLDSGLLDPRTMRE